MIAAIRPQIALMNIHNFTVERVLTDGEYFIATAKAIIVGVTLGANAGEDAKIGERGIRFIKRRSRGVINCLPFNFPMHWLQYLVFFLYLCLNFIPPATAPVAATPREVMTGLKLDYQKHLQCPFGAYVQAYRDKGVLTTPSWSEQLEPSACGLHR